MKSIVSWALNNTPGMNTILVAILAVGALSMFTLRREVFPEFELEIVLITVPYPGADPEEISDSICEKIEEAVSGIEYVKEMTSIAQVGLGSVILELEADVPNVQKVLNEVRSEVDQAATFFPELAEDHEVKQLTMREAGIRVGIVVPQSASEYINDEARLEAEISLRSLTEEIRDELVQLPTVSQAEILGAKEYQIDVEMDESTLRRYGLSLQRVAEILRDENIKLPGGTLKGPSQDVLLKGDNRRKIGEEIAELPILTDQAGVVLTVEDLGTVKDGFADATSETYVNGLPGMVISVDRTKEEDILAMTDEVRQYVESKEMPPGYQLLTFDDRSVDVKDRIDLLVKNGLQGLILVFIALAVFLELRLAFWVALGIPISILGSCIFLMYGDQTLNMLSLFAFLMGLGILVDDAIVVGENIYAHREMGKTYWQAAVDGTAEVFPSVITAVTTTIVAMMPMLFVSGVMGKFIAVLPIALIACLLISLFESLFILPCHLAHEHEEGFLERLRRKMPLVVRWFVGAFFMALTVLCVWAILEEDIPSNLMMTGMLALAGMASAFLSMSILGVFGAAISVAGFITPRADRLLDNFLDRFYMPSLRWAIAHPSISISSAVFLFLITIGFVAAGFAPFNFFPKLDSKIVQATVRFPDGSPSNITREATELVEKSLQEINKRYVANGIEPVRFVRRTVGFVVGQSTTGQQSQSDGTHLGQVFVELVDTALRDVNSQEFVAAWREATPEIAGAESVVFESPSFGPAGKTIEFKLLASRSGVEQQEAAVEEIKDKLRTYAGVFDVDDDDQPGKAEIRVNLKPDALALGITQRQLTNAVRAAYYGEEVMRLQRGRHEVKLMVRFPREDRRNMSDFERIRVRTDDGLQRPITELATIEVGRGPSEINRVSQQRSITISADVDESIGNAGLIVTDLKNNFMPQIYEAYPGVSVKWKGQQEQQQESFQSLFIGLGVAMAVMYVLLTLEFRSYLQPAIILLIVPFGIVGAIWGHAFMGLPVTLFSLFGIVALTGVVVNDSIVLVDFINHRIDEDYALDTALVDAGRRRFRPVMLTSLTTICGLIPMLTETSFQAQILIPMACSLCFGLMLATILVVYMVPVIYGVYGRMTGRGMMTKVYEPSFNSLPAVEQDEEPSNMAGAV
ncbi:efflux RND transporter permease subunit [Calycomorphotria hydatis]|uniref:Multidrug resistance protein MdtB n=1 Tax=Calycomorphotria hydatis TaxID=2528027 RepID=A0A517T7V2_9PLAN|nr:efflux RND transporter permease subunit [Calycomorphotria hydatis]QDT64447.1 Multidrug resistance protein MdtB [Calycomorphotria hydatis]